MPVKKFFAERKRKKMLPVTAVCRNCGTSLHGRYCHHCGQYLFTGTNRSFRNLVFNALESIFSIDNKLFITLKALLFQPGKLTKEYIGGRVVSYVHPSKLFWFISILFFALFTSLVTDNKSAEPIATEDTKASVAGNSALSNQTEIVGSFDSTSENLKKEKNNNKKESDYLLKNYYFQNYFMTYAPYISFLLIPFFGILLNTFFRKKELYYVDHMTFALHFHAFIFLLFTLCIILYKIYPDFDHEAVIFIVIPLAYFICSLWNVYRPKIRSVIFKSITIMIVYGIAIISALVVLFVVSAKLSGMFND